MGRETLFCKTECGLRSADWATTRLPDRAGRKGPSSHLHPQRRHPGPADGTATLGLPEQGRNLEHPPDTGRGHPADHGPHPVRGLRRAFADGGPHRPRRVRTRPVGCGPQGRSPVHRRGPCEWWQGLPLLPAAGPPRSSGRSVPAWPTPPSHRVQRPHRGRRKPRRDGRPHRSVGVREAIGSFNRVVGEYRGAAYEERSRRRKAFFGGKNEAEEGYRPG